MSARERPAYTDKDTIRVNNLGELSSVIKSHGYLMRVRIAAELTGVTRQYLYRLVEEGYFRKFYILGELHVTEDEVLLWFDKRNAVPLESEAAQMVFA